MSDSEKGRLLTRRVTISPEVIAAKLRSGFETPSLSSIAFATAKRGMAALRPGGPAAKGNHTPRFEMTEEHSPALYGVQRILREGHGTSGGCSPGVHEGGLNQVELLTGPSEVAAALVVMKFETRISLKTEYQSNCATSSP